MKVTIQLLGLIGMNLILSCSITTPGVFSKKTPHEQYGQKITDAGLKETALGRAWFQAADKSLSQPFNVSIPYKETGYFPAEMPQATGFRFIAKRGEKITIDLSKKPAAGFLIYMDLWRYNESKNKMLMAADTSGTPLQYEIDNDGTYILRIQPELLQAGEYTITINSGPSLAYPIKAPGTNHIKSFWGAPREGGIRNHEGIDMFASFGTPVIAAADGRVTTVNENSLGGKVVFMKPHNKNYTLYYAHLDQQLVQPGQSVKTGDTLGLMGNTGNAKSTSPHLHFGIYTAGGAIDPLPFVNPIMKNPHNIQASLNNLGKSVRSDHKAVKIYNDPSAGEGSVIESNTLLKVEAATSNFYKIKLPDGRRAYINSSAVTDIKPIRSYKLTSIKPVYDKPDSSAAKKKTLMQGEIVYILSSFSAFYYISYQKDMEGWISK